jgi:pimeloyl-ACP methyl ester carboxylesterase
MTNWSIEAGMSIRRFGSGPEVVWIHGLGESSTSFDPIARRSELGGYTHVLPDLPGYGRSAWHDAPRTLEALADRLAGWLGARPPAVLIGHSMGGVLATLVAERAAVRGVIDIDGNLTRGDCTFSATATSYSLVDFAAGGFDAMRDAVYARGASEAALRGYHAAMMFASPDVFHGHAADLIAMSARADLAPRLAALRIPSLFVAGVPRGVCEASRAALTAAGAKWIGLEPAGHWVYLDQPDPFTAAVATFLAGA